MSELLTVAQVAIVLQVSEDTIVRRFAKSLAQNAHADWHDQIIASNDSVSVAFATRKCWTQTEPLAFVLGHFNEGASTRNTRFGNFGI